MRSFMPIGLLILFMLGVGCSRVTADEPDAQNIGADEIAVGAPLQIPLTQTNRPTQPTTEENEAPSTTAVQPSDPATKTEVIAPPVTGKPSEKATSKIDRSPQRASTKHAAEAPQPGWLGLIVDDSLVTGRLVIVEVTAPSPAHEVGIKPQDVLLAIDGQQVQSADQLAALLSAISPHESVRALVGRPNGVKEVTMTAVERPTSTRSPAAVDLVEAGKNTKSSIPTTGSRFTPSPTASQLAANQDTPQQPLQAVAPSALTTTSGAELTRSAPQPKRSRFSQNGAQQPTALPAPDAAPFSQALPPSSLPQTPAIGPPVSPPALRGPAAGGRTALGVRTLPIDSATQSRYQLPDTSGAYVIGVIESLPASQAGLPPGSVIVAFDNRAVRSPAELNRLVTGSPPGRLVAVQYVLPGGESHRAEVELQALDPALEEALVGIPTAAQQPTSSLPRTVRRLPTHSPNLESDDTRMLTEEIDLLRQEILRLRFRLDRLESTQPSAGRQHGAMTR